MHGIYCRDSCPVDGFRKCTKEVGFIRRFEDQSPFGLEQWYTPNLLLRRPAGTEEWKSENP